jgi:hypothetical protein
MIHRSGRDNRNERGGRAYTGSSVSLSVWEGLPARIESKSRSIDGDSSHLSQRLLQVRYQYRFGADCEAHSGNENTVEEALRDRRKSIIPNRIDEDQRLRRW